MGIHIPTLQKRKTLSSTSFYLSLKNVCGLLPHLDRCVIHYGMPVSFLFASLVPNVSGGLVGFSIQMESVNMRMVEAIINPECLLYQKQFDYFQGILGCVDFHRSCQRRILVSSLFAGKSVKQKHKHEIFIRCTYILIYVTEWILIGQEVFQANPRPSLG